MRKVMAAVLGVVAGMFMFAASVSAHCDTMNGPVITAAKQALESGNVNLVLIWVQKNDDKAVKEAFKKTLMLRKQGGEASKKADMEFFEALVRIHRAGEGEEFTGIKEAAEPEAAVAASDKAVESGSIDGLESVLTEAVKRGLNNKFKEVLETRKYNKDNVKAGRKYIKAYVEFIHYAEGVFEAASKAGHHAKDAAGHAEK